LVADGSAISFVSMLARARISGKGTCLNAKINSNTRVPAIPPLKTLFTDKKGDGRSQYLAARQVKMTLHDSILESFRIGIRPPEPRTKMMVMPT
jgi:hypothetical protein